MIDIQFHVASLLKDGSGIWRMWRQIFCEPCLTFQSWPHRTQSSQATLAPGPHLTWPQTTCPPFLLRSNHAFPKNTENRPGTANHTIVFSACFQHQHLLVTQQFHYFPVLTLQPSTPEEPYPAHVGHKCSKLMGVWWKGLQTCSQTPNATSEAGPEALHSSPSSHQTSCCSSLPFGSHRDLPVVDQSCLEKEENALCQNRYSPRQRKTRSQHTKIVESTISRKETSSGTSDP